MVLTESFIILRLGLEDNLGIEPVSEVGFNTGFDDQKKNLSFRTELG